MANPVDRVKRKRPWYAGLVLLGALVGLIVLAELLLWAVGMQSLRQKMMGSGGMVKSAISSMTEDPRLGWSLIPNIEYEMDNVTYKINSLGLRGPEVEAAKPHGTLRVLCLGDSTTYGVMVNERQIYARVLESLLAERLAPRPVQVLNAGVPGYTSVQVMLYLAKQGFSFKPDVITFCAGYNDVRNISKAKSSDSKMFFLWSYYGKRVKLKLGRSRLFTLLNRLIERILVPSEAPEIPPERADTPLNRSDVKHRVSVETYQAQLMALANECKKRGIDLVFFRFSVPEPYAGTMWKVAEKMHIPFVDMEPVFEQMAILLDASPSESSSTATSATEKPPATALAATTPQAVAPLTPAPSGPLALSPVGPATSGQGGAMPQGFSPLTPPGAMGERTSGEVFSEEMKKRRSNKALFADYCHPGVLGHKLIAEHLADLIVEQLGHQVSPTK